MIKWPESEDWIEHPLTVEEYRFTNKPLTNGYTMEKSDYEKLITESEEEIKNLKESNEYNVRHMAQYGSRINDAFNKIDKLQFRISGFQSEIKRLDKEPCKKCEDCE